jgi:DNA polymerase III sliding clamp (beta) subunit (PCNA family)
MTATATQKPKKTIGRELFLSALKKVMPGLSTTESVEQSSCFVFRNGMIATFNEEICCRYKFDAGIEGAVTGNKLVEILNKLTEDKIDIRNEEGVVKIKAGTSRLVSLVKDESIVLPIDTVESAGDWHPISADFKEAVSVAQQCTVKEHQNFCLTCINVTPTFIEASDNFQIARYPVKTIVKKPTLVKADALRLALTEDNVCEYSISPAWMHFRSADGFIFSCRRYTDDYPDATSYIDDEEGEYVTIPGGMSEAVEKAKVFSSERADNDNVLVRLSPKGMIIQGNGVSGSFREIKDAQGYRGPEITFMISPDILSSISGQHSKCLLSEKRLKASHEKYTYVTALSKADE